MRPSRLIPISASDQSQTGSARRQALALAAAMEFDELRQGQLGIIVAEASRNIAAHAGSGKLSSPRGATGRWPASTCWRWIAARASKMSPPP